MSVRGTRHRTDQAGILTGFVSGRGHGPLAQCTKRGKPHCLRDACNSTRAAGPSLAQICSRCARAILLRARAQRPFSLERDDFSSNRHPALTSSWSMIFFRKPVPTFRDHALKRDDNVIPLQVYCWSMIFSDLPPPAEASSRTTDRATRLRAGGKPVPTPDHVRGRPFRIMLISRCSSGAPRLPRCRAPKGCAAPRRTACLRPRVSRAPWCG